MFWNSIQLSFKNSIYGEEAGTSAMQWRWDVVKWGQESTQRLSHFLRFEKEICHTPVVWLGELLYLSVPPIS